MQTNVCWVSLGKPEEKRQLGDPVMGRRKVLKWIMDN
jgi:hypothetical protein